MAGGHVHFAQLSCPMYNGKCVTAVDEDGYDAPIHAVIGNGGPQEPSAKSSSEWSRYLGHDNGFVIIEAHNSSDLSITFFGDEPNAEAPPPLNHQHHIRRTRTNKPPPAPPAPPPAPPPSPPPPNEGGVGNLQWLGCSDDFIPAFKGATNMLAESANFATAVTQKASLGLPTFWGDSCFPGAMNCSGNGGPVLGPKGCLKNGGCWHLKPQWEAEVNTAACRRLFSLGWVPHTEGACVAG